MFKCAESCTNVWLLSISVRLNTNSMGQAKDVLLRQQVTLDHNLGDSYSSLAARYGLSYERGSNHLHTLQGIGLTGLIPRYANCGRQVAEK